MKNIEKLQKSKSSNVRSLAENGYLRTGHYTGSGRHTKAVSCMSAVKAELEALGIGYATGNDAPRGGVAGEFIVLTSRDMIKGKTEAQKYLKKATYTWKKPKPYTSEELLEFAEKAISLCDPADESDKDGRYWLNCYHGCGVYRLIIADGKIQGSIYGGIHNSRPMYVNRAIPTPEDWEGIILAVVREKFPEARLVKADGSGTYFYLRNPDDAELLKVREYDVPSAYGGTHHNIEVVGK